MDLEEYLAIPYKLIMESFEGPDGDWLRRASYPELPGCDVEGLWAVDVVESLEQLRGELAGASPEAVRGMILARVPEYQPSLNKCPSQQ